MFNSAIQFYGENDPRPVGPKSAPTAPANNEASVTSLRAPTFEYGEAWAATSRQAGRLNAAHVSDDEIRKLLAERQALLDKKFDGSMTRSEEIRLEYIRWSLDRIEDARYGAYLDRLESAVGRYEGFQGDLANLIQQLTQFSGRSGERRR